MEKMNIYNFKQANFLIKRNAKVIGCGTNKMNGNYYISFLRDEDFKSAMDIWCVNKNK